MGDRLATIERACKELDAHDDVALVRTSGLWQTKAMYVTEQDDFLNGVCEIETFLEPLDLLDRLQSIEKQLGRRRLIDKGPRTLDLDILLYDDRVIENDRLIVPHKLMLERPFVLHPLCQLIPDQIVTFRSATSSTHHNTFLDHLRLLPRDGDPTSTVTPLSEHAPPLQALIPSRQTQIMAILNTTPDSFSDGGLHDPQNTAALTSTIKSCLDAGATIVDIGGQSSRPHAVPITAEEEIARVLPAIRIAKDLIQGRFTTSKPRYSAAISIDTYRAEVARAALSAGADIINDVSSGALDVDMLDTMAQSGRTVVLMHMRGDPMTMTTKENTSYPGGLIEDIGTELLQKVRAAEAAGIRRWRIVLDPGFGFAKTQAQNLELLRRFDELRGLKGLEGFPWVVGVSRKGFLGKITGVAPAGERDWETAAVVDASIRGGADIARVHNVAAMRRVAQTADAVWRCP